MITPADMIAEILVRHVTEWCDVSGTEFADPSTDRTFACLIHTERRETLYLVSRYPDDEVVLVARTASGTPLPSGRTGLGRILASAELLNALWGVASRAPVVDPAPAVHACRHPGAGKAVECGASAGRARWDPKNLAIGHGAHERNARLNGMREALIRDSPSFFACPCDCHKPEQP